VRPLDWHLNDRYPHPEQYLGPITRYLDADSSLPCWTQLDEAAPHGWNPQLPGQGWELTADDRLVYPGLPPLAPAAFALHLGERIFIYPPGWVCIVQLGGAYSIGRLA